jgi:hypothetical protein
MHLKFQVEETLHGPARISDMTGLSMDGQRNWRQRGHLGPSDGPRGKMSTSAVAALAVRAFAAELGYPARDSEQLGVDAGPSVIYPSLLDSPWAAIKLEGSPAAKQAFRVAHEGSTQIASAISGLGDCRPATTISWFDQDPPTLTASPNLEPWEGYEITLRRINLIGIGARLIQYAGKPLFTVAICDVK